MEFVMRLIGGAVIAAALLAALQALGSCTVPV